MAETEWEESGAGQGPGADVGDDGDIPDDPLLDAETGSNPAGDLGGLGDEGGEG